MTYAEAKDRTAEAHEYGHRDQNSITEDLVKEFVFEGILPPEELITLETSLGKSRWVQPDTSD